MRKSLVLISILFIGLQANAQDSLMMRKIATEILMHDNAYENLRYLCKNIGNRLSGTPEAEEAVKWGQKAMEQAGADKVWLQPVDVPYWYRGHEKLSFQIENSKDFVDVPMTSLGNTVGTDGKLMEGAIIMVQNFDEFDQLKSSEVKGKIVFFNYRFRQDLLHPFEGYGDAGPYRWHSPNKASAKGAKAVIIRSVSTGKDDFPHTGSLRYADSIKPIPAVAIGNETADLLEKECNKGFVRARLQSDCKMIGTKRSYNVIGEIEGTEHPGQIVLVGGHLDSWDVGEGAHDDGAGCVQSIEVIRAMKALGIRPKYTVRAVLFMNEENGLKGGYAYADSAKANHEKHILAIESDAGGFSPRGFGLRMDEEKRAQIKAYKHLFYPYGVYDFEHEEGGADISPLYKQDVPAAGLMPDPQRYFDLHHTANDVFEQINHRELKMGAVALANLVYLVSEHGLK